MGLGVRVRIRTRLSNSRITEPLDCRPIHYVRFSCKWLSFCSWQKYKNESTKIENTTKIHTGRLYTILGWVQRQNLCSMFFYKQYVLNITQPTSDWNKTEVSTPRSQWMNFENWSIYAEDMDKNFVSCFLWFTVYTTDELYKTPC